MAQHKTLLTDKMCYFLVPTPSLRGGTLVVPQTFDYIGLHSATYSYIIPLNPNLLGNFGQTTYLTY